MSATPSEAPKVLSAEEWSDWEYALKRALSQTLHAPIPHGGLMASQCTLCFAIATYRAIDSLRTTLDRLGEPDEAMREAVAEAITDAAARWQILLRDEWEIKVAEAAIQAAIKAAARGDDEKGT